MKHEVELLSSLLVAAHRLTRIAALTTGNTTPSAVWNTLSILSTDGPSRVGELARAARVTQPSMTKVVQQLVEDSFVVRVDDPEDSRASLISVTTSGVDALVAWRIALATALEPLFADMSTTDRAALTRAVDVITSRTATERVDA